MENCELTGLACLHALDMGDQHGHARALARSCKLGTVMKKLVRTRTIPNVRLENSQWGRTYWYWFLNMHWDWFWHMYWVGVINWYFHWIMDNLKIFHCDYFLSFSSTWFRIHMGKKVNELLPSRLGMGVVHELGPWLERQRASPLDMGLELGPRNAAERSLVPLAPSSISW